MSTIKSIASLYASSLPEKQKQYILHDIRAKSSYISVRFYK